MGKLLLNTWLALPLCWVQAQDISGTIQGKITDGQGEALQGINVGLRGTTFGSPTEENGFYRIKNVNPGNYTLVVSGIGFEGQRQEVVLDAAKTVDHDFSLGESPQLLQTVEVTGRREQAYRLKLSNSLAI